MFFEKIVLVENVLLQKHFLGNSLDEKKMFQNLYGRTFLLLQNHSLGKSLDEKLF